MSKEPGDVDPSVAPERARSAYDTLQDRLTPLLKDKPLAHLTDAEINALAAEAGLEPEVIAALVQSAILSRETGLPTGLFYALGGPGKTMNLRNLFERSPERLREELDRAIHNNAVSVALRDQLGSLEVLRQAHEPLTTLAPRLHIDIPQQLAQALLQKHIHTLTDIRQAGGLSRMEGLTEFAGTSSLQLLDAHANLSVLSTDATVNAKLIDRGFASVLAIADAPRHEFLGAMSGLVGTTVAKSLHDKAITQKLHVQNFLTGALANAANRYKDQDGFLRKAWGEDAPPEKCRCKDCEAAVSPLAYLADLLAYAQKYVLQNASKALLTFVDSLSAKPMVLPQRGTGNGGTPKPPPAPIFHPPGGNVGTYEVDVALQGVYGVKMFYTDNGSDPDPTSSSEYRSPIRLRNTQPNPLQVTIKAISARYDYDGGKWLTSTVRSATYLLGPMTRADTPTIIPAQQTALYAPATVFIRAAEDTTIRYTTDRSEPTESSPVYVWDAAIPLNNPGTYTIKARGFRDGSEPSPIVSAVVIVEAAPPAVPDRGLTAEYYQNSDLSNLRVVRKDWHLQFDWKGGPPDPQIEPDTFSARWTGWITPLSTEDYTFYTIADDGIRLYVDGQSEPVIDKWILQSPTEHSSRTVRLQAGRKHSITVEYFENQGRAVAMLLWRSPSQRKEVIPASLLSPSNIDLDFLERTFHQPFGQMPASCEFAGEQVRQVRICIEVLRRYLGPRRLADTNREASLRKAEEGYLLTAYSLLLSKIGTSYEEIRLARSADEQTRQALADRLGIGIDDLDELFLDPGAQPSTLTEAKLEEIFGLRDTNLDPLTKTPTSLLLQRRLRCLRILWKEQDWPVDASSDNYPPLGRLHIIDPDVIGPDDFRVPVPKANSADPDKAFDLWLRRRAWVDGRIQELSAKTKEMHSRQVPDIEAMLTSMYEEVSYPSVPPYPVPPWPSTTPVSEFDSLYEKLTRGTADEVKQAKDRIQNDLSLTSESFTRLIAIRAKDKQWESDERNEQVIDKEWREVYSILVQARKERVFGAWMVEEQIAGVLLGPKEFWHSLQEPKEGDWPPAEPRPFIDPDSLKINELPESTVGKRAMALWQERKDSLADINKVLRKKREAASFDAMLMLALGDPHPGDALQYDLTRLQSDLNSTDPRVVEDATKKIGNALHMTVESFNRLMTIKAKDAQADPLKKPMAAEYAEVYTILTQSRKKKHEYPGWIDAENDPATGVVYWKALKAKLPPWRATAEARQAWVTALRFGSSAPILDPDVVGPGDLKTPYRGNLAFAIWDARTTLLTQWIEALNASPQTLPGLDTILQSTIGVHPWELTQLVEKRKQGHDITARLEQLSLDTAAFSYLMRIRNLAVNNQPILGAEWDQVYSILAQVKKRREYADWRESEYGHNNFDGILTLSPNYFKVPQIDKTVFPPPPPPWEPIPWRSTWEARIDWQDKFQSRLDQEKDVEEALKAAVNATEEATLPMLRDALVMAVDKGGSTLDSKAKWVIDYLLIDAKAGGCQTTTRIAQAIETIQSLLWSLRTGQLKDTYPGLDLVAPNFDEEWKWIGSYATWRAAMFVFMYPENILLPSLRKHQTPAFRKLVSDLRGNRRLTPQQARTAAKAYSDYLRDICSLQLEARTNARPHGYGHDLLYLFARSAVSQKVYWSYYDPMADPSYAQSFWAEIDGLKEVINLIGAVVYGQKEQGIYLFARTQESTEQKLVFIRYDLGKEEGWSQEAIALELPKKATDFTARLKQTSVSEPPQIGIWLPNGSIWLRSLNVKGNAWETDDFKSGIKQIIFAQWRDVPASELGNPKSKFPPADFSAKDVADRFTGVNDYAGAQGYYGGFPNFHEAGREYGTILLTPKAAEWRNIPASELGNPKSKFPPADFSAKDVAIRFIAVNNYAYRSSYVGGFPNFHEANYGAGRVYGTFLLTPEAAEFRGDIPASELGHPKSILAPDFSARDVADRFTAVSDYAVRKGYVGGFPSFHEADSGAGRVYGAILIKQPVEVDVAIGPWVPPCQYDPNIVPRTIPLEISEQLSDAQRQARKKLIEEAYLANEPGRRSNLTYIEEAYYFVPMQIALQLQQRGEYIAALDWFRAIYNYSAPLGQRKIYYGLTKEESRSEAYSRVDNWLLDPLNPHAIAETRRNAYTRYTLFSLIRCFLEYADAEFTRDTAESVSRARTLYLTALELLDSHELTQRSNACEELIAALDSEVRGSIQAEAPQWLTVWFDIKTAMATFADFATLEGVVDQVKPQLKSPWGVALAHAKQIIDAANTSPAPETMAGVLEERDRMLVRASAALAADPVTSGVGLPTATQVAEAKTLLLEKSELRVSFGYVPILAYTFCIPANPVLNALKLRAELNLYKLRHCRNIAGMQRQLEPYAAPTDTTSGLPTIGFGGQLVLPGATVLRPTPYRFRVLIERAKQLVQLATQIEAAMLSALEKRDAEAYSLLKARQDVRLARAGVRLQTLRVTEAEGGVTLAELQQERAQLQVTHYQELVDGDLLISENLALGFLIETAVLHGLAAGASATAAGIHFATVVGVPEGWSSTASATSSMAAVTSTMASYFSTLASYERRKQEWEFQKTLAGQDVKIGAQQVQIAEDHVKVVGQEKVIAEMQADHAQAVVDFLSNKFTNVELYDWMSDVLEGVYSFFLQQATSVAKLAENQLAFERHEVPPSYIQADYWEAPREDMGSATDGRGPDRRGLTGSARLLQDIYQLDQYAFETDKRKLQLTKTVSLAQMSPAEFQRFRETGVMTFRTPIEIFDRDFPGHYLRLIKRVRTSVIALIPPVQGIKATLTSSGLSRVVIGGDIFQTIIVRRDPEAVALTSPLNATGLFELEAQSEMLFPFEAIGVDSAWEFRMPKAANLFDYSTIADVLITVEYTALDSFDYRQQVAQTLPSAVSADRPFSFQYQFADQWYDLHNPEQTKTPMVVRFNTGREDFPPNLDGIKIQQVLLYFARASGKTFEVPVTSLRFTERAGGSVGGAATTMDGVISTRRGNAGSWTAMLGKAPYGEWELTLPNTEEMKNRFTNEEIEDILFVITYTGRTPEWPS